MSQKTVWGSKVIILILLIVGLLSGVILAQRRQDLAGRAYTSSAASGRFGVALGTWNYGKMLCFDLDGKPFSSCTKSPIKFNPDNFSDMNFMAYDGSKNQLNKTAFNISAFDRLDPSANTQFIWFHYEDNQGNSLKPINSYLTPDQMWQKDPSLGTRIYATSGAPGSVRVIVKKPDETNPNFRLELARPTGQPEIVYKQGYPHCNNCIFRPNDFFNILKSPNFSGFDDGQGNWYAFYLLAETEYPIQSHYLSPKRYAAVFNEYVGKMKISGMFPKARFIVESPAVISATDLETRIKPYFNELLGYLTPESKKAISYMGLDAFFGPPSKPDYQIGNWSPVTDGELKVLANDFMVKITPTALFLRDFSKKPVLLTQVGSILHGTNNPVANTISFGGVKCEWCTNNNNDIWSTTQFGHARLTQLIFRELNRRANTGGPIQAWAYWGNVRQPYWTEPLIQKTWGDINHGVNWLTWPFLCTPNTNCSDTYLPWPTWSGMVYLKMANRDMVWRPQWKNPKTGAVTTAPNWWPTNEVWP